MAMRFNVRHLFWRLVTPSRVLTAAWMLCLVFLGTRVGNALTVDLKPESAYFCEFGRDCRNNNQFDRHCCLNPGGSDERRTGLYVCRPTCLELNESATTVSVR